MSVINKEPYINKILKQLSEEELEDLQYCVNGQGAAPVFKSLVPNSPYLLTTDDYGIYPVDLELALQKSGIAQNVLRGYLIYKEDGEGEGNDLCALIAYSGVAQQALGLYVMHKENGLWKYLNRACNLTITDLRSELFDVAGGGSGGGDTNLAPLYDEESTYAEGDLVMYADVLYVCTTDIEEAEEWNPEHWEQTTIAESVLGLINTGI